MIKNNSSFNDEMNVPHRTDLADLIIAKAIQIRQDQNLNLTYFFAAKPLVRFSAFLMLLFAFFVGFENASNKYYQPDNFDQKLAVEEIYTNSDLL